MSESESRRAAQVVVEDLNDAERELLALHERGTTLLGASLSAGAAVDAARRAVECEEAVDAVALIAALSEVEVGAAAVARAADSIGRLLRGLPVQLVVS